MSEGKTSTSDGKIFPSDVENFWKMLKISSSSSQKSMKKPMKMKYLFCRGRSLKKVADSELFILREVLFFLRPHLSSQGLSCLAEVWQLSTRGRRPRVDSQTKARQRPRLDRGRRKESASQRMKRSLRLFSEGWNPYRYIFSPIWGLTYNKRSEARGHGEATAIASRFLGVPLKIAGSRPILTFEAAASKES